jgi:predicted transcriptional regulator
VVGMAQYRTQTKIIADILTTARDMNTAGDGVGITTLLRRGNVSYTRMTKLITDLTDLVGAGLLVELNAEKISKYKISDKGMSFLLAYGEFEDFAQSFGLRL